MRFSFVKNSLAFGTGAEDPESSFRHRAPDRGRTRSLLEKNERLVLCTLLALNLALCIMSVRNKSLTYDEPTYIGLGNYTIETGDVRALAGAFPLLPCFVNGFFWNFLHFDHITWQSFPRMHELHYQSLPLIFESRYDPNLLIFLARLPVILLFPALGLMVFRWTRRLYSTEAAFVALFLAALSPNLMAHARLATTDFVTTVTVFGALFSFWLYVQERSFGWLFVCGIATGLALLAKFTAVLLLPIYLVLIVIVNVKNLPAYNLRSIARVLFFLKTNEQEKKNLGIMPVLGIFLISFLVIWAGYFFEYRPLYVPRFVSGGPGPVYGGIMKPLFDRQVRLPAATYLVSFYQQVIHNRRGHQGFFLGAMSYHGSWRYFPVAFLIKTPIPTLIFLVLACIHWFRPGSTKKADEAFLLVPVFVLFSFSIVSNVNIGIRHILPIFPFLFVWAGKAVTISGSKSYRRLLALLLLWYAGSNLYIYPHYLEYFNEFIGGPKNGYKYLVDSNLDWGQDLKLLDQYVKKKDIKPLKLVYFGAPKVAFYSGYHNSVGDCRHVGEGYLAISATCLGNIYLPEHCYDWLKDYQPIDRIAYSIFIYKFPASQGHLETELPAGS